MQNIFYEGKVIFSNISNKQFDMENLFNVNFSINSINILYNKNEYLITLEFLDFKMVNIWPHD